MTSRRTSWTVCFACFVIYAYVVTSIGPVLPRLSEEFALPPDLAGILVALGSVGGLMSVLGGWLSDKLNRVLIGAISMATLALSSLILALSSNLYTVSSSLILMSMAAGFLEPSLNAFVSDLYPGKRGLSVNLLHIAWNIGSALGPSSAALIIVVTGSWRKAYLCALPASILVSALLARLNRSASESRREHAAPHGSALLSMRAAASFLPMAFIGFFYVASEMGISTWLAFILEELGSAVFEAGLATGLYWGLMGLGRLVWAPATDKIGYARSIAAASGLALVCMVAATSPLPIYVKMMFWASSGFFLAPIFPTLIAWGTSVNPSAGGTLSGLVFTLGTLGLFSSNSLAGLVAASFGVEAAQYVFVFFAAGTLTNVLIVRLLLE